MPQHLYFCDSPAKTPITDLYFVEWKTILSLLRPKKGLIVKKLKLKNSGVRKQRKQRKKNGKRLQQTHQGRKTQDLLF